MLPQRQTGINCHDPVLLHGGLMVDCWRMFCWQRKVAPLPASMPGLAGVGIVALLLHLPLQTGLQLLLAFMDELAGRCSPAG